MNGMQKTTVYLEDRQVETLHRLSRETGRPVAELVREAVDALGERMSVRLRPTFGMFASGRKEATGRNAEEILEREGFGL